MILKYTKKYKLYYILIYTEKNRLFVHTIFLMTFYTININYSC